MITVRERPKHVANTLGCPLSKADRGPTKVLCFTQSPTSSVEDLLPASWLEANNNDVIQVNQVNWMNWVNQINILKYGKSDLKKENHLLALEKEEEKENTRDRSAHDGSDKKVGIMNDK